MRGCVGPHRLGSMVNQLSPAQASGDGIAGAQLAPTAALPTAVAPPNACQSGHTASLGDPLGGDAGHAASLGGEPPLGGDAEPADTRPTGLDGAASGLSTKHDSCPPSPASGLATLWAPWAADTAAAGPIRPCSVGRRGPAGASGGRSGATGAGQQPPAGEPGQLPLAGEPGATWACQLPPAVGELRPRPWPEPRPPPLPRPATAPALARASSADIASATRGAATPASQGALASPEPKWLLGRFNSALQSSQAVPLIVTRCSYSLDGAGTMVKIPKVSASRVSILAGELEQIW